MTSTSDRPPFRRSSRTLWIAALLALASLPVLADEAGTAAPDQAPADGAERVYVLDGATISWDLDRRRFHPPTARQASRLAEELRRWLDAKQAGGEGRFATKEIEVETLPGGVKRARLPLSLMSFAVVDGEGLDYCAEGPVAAGELLSRPADADAEEE